MTESIGLKALFDDRDFQNGLKRYLDGVSRAHGDTAKAAASVSSSTDAIGRAWSGLGGVMQSAMGFVVGGVIVKGFEAIGRAALNSAGDAYEAVASYERLALVTQTLVARELAQGQETTVLAQTRVSLTDEEREKLEDLRDTEQGLVADIGAAQARLEKQMAGTWVGSGQERHLEYEDPRIIAERQQNIDALNKKLAETRQEIAALSEKEGSLATVEKVVWTNQMSMADAMAQAGPKAKELLEWIQMLAIKSPLGMADVADMFRLSMVYDFTTEEAQRLTKALVDMGAGSGLTGDVLQRVAMSLGQINSMGKISGMEVRELARAGVPIKSILAKSLGVTTKELESMLEEGLVPTGDALDRIITWMEESFPNAAEAQAESWGGLKESMGDLKQLLMREFLTPVMEPFRPLVANLVDTLISNETRAKVRNAGERLGSMLALGLQGDWHALLAGMGVPQSVLSSIENLKITWDSTWASLKDLLGPVWTQITGGAGEELAKLPGIITDKLWQARGELAKLSNWLQTEGEDAPLHQVGLQAAGLVLKGIISGLAGLAGQLDAKSELFLEWARSSATQAALEDTGAAISAAIVTDIAKGLSSDEAGQSMSRAILVGVGNAVSNILEAIYSFGGGLAEGIIEGIVGTFASPDTAKTVGRSIVGTFYNLGKLFNFPLLLWEALIQKKSLDEIFPATPLSESITKGGQGGYAPERPLDTSGGPTAAWTAQINAFGGVGTQPYGPALPPLWEEDAERRKQAEIEAEQLASLPPSTQEALKLWQEDSKRRTFTEDELAALGRLPQPTAAAVGWALEIQNRVQKLQAERDRLAAQPMTQNAAPQLWAEHARREDDAAVQLRKLQLLPFSGAAVQFWQQVSALDAKSQTALGAIAAAPNAALSPDYVGTVPKYATGLDRIYTQPTMFQGVIAEHAPERVQITPAGGGGGGGVTINIGAIYAPGGGAQVRASAEKGVLQALRASGQGVR